MFVLETSPSPPKTPNVTETWSATLIKGQVVYERFPIHWIGLRENLQETMVFTTKYRAFLQIFPSSNSMTNVMSCLVIKSPSGNSGSSACRDVIGTGSPPKPPNVDPTQTVSAESPDFPLVCQAWHELRIAKGLKDPTSMPWLLIGRGQKGHHRRCMILVQLCATWGEGRKLGQVWGRSGKSAAGVELEWSAASGVVKGPDSCNLLQCRAQQIHRKMCCWKHRSTMCVSYV